MAKTQHKAPRISEGRNRRWPFVQDGKAREEYVVVYVMFAKNMVHGHKHEGKDG